MVLLLKKILIFILVIGIVLPMIFFKNKEYKVVGDYDKKIGGEILQGNEAYDIGVAENGMPIFKNTDKAFKQAKADFDDGFKLIKDQFNLKKVSKLYWKPYKTYGWQAETKDEELRKQCGEITVFFDIYENSFE